MSYPDGIGPRVVGYQLASHIYQYLMRAVDLGFLDGPIGQMKINPGLLPILDAASQVLAGGEVKIEITHRGNPDIVHELNRLLQEGLDESNTINEKAGFYLTIGA
jgi:hypothetical protein